MDGALVLLLASFAFAPIAYLIMNAVADVWEKAMHKPFWIRRYFKPFIAICLVLSVVQYVLSVIA